MWIAAGLLAVLTVIAVVSAPPPEAEQSTFPSSYSATAGGARAAFLLLQRMGMHGQRWEEPPFNMEVAAPIATAVFAGPADKPSHGEQEALRRFVFKGGRVLFCGRNYLDFFGEVIPERISHDLWATTYGSGQIVRWRTAGPLTNAQLSKNLPLFLNSVGVGERRIVYWDEYFHGERGSLWDYIGRVPAIRWALLPFGLLMVTILLTFSRRRGPVVSPVRVTRLAPLEFVESLGQLYKKARATGLPVEVTARELRLRLLRKLALPSEIHDDRLASEAAARLGWDERKLNQLFASARQMKAGGAVPVAKALDLVQQLQKLSGDLRI